MKTYRLQSSPVVYAPGIIVWARSGYFHEPDQAMLRGVIVKTWSGIPEDVVGQVLSGTLPYTVEGETVVITA